MFIGGALALVKPIEKRYRTLGGTIKFNSKVVKILVENDKAVGIQLANGEEYRATISSRPATAVRRYSICLAVNTSMKRLKTGMTIRIFRLPDVHWAGGKTGFY